MRLTFVLAIACSLFAAQAMAADNCEGPTSGELDNPPINFSYESWKKPRDSSHDWKFVHCIENLTGQTLWFDCKIVRLHGYLPGGKAALLARIAAAETQKDRQTELWYGPSPDSQETPLVLIPNERDTASLALPSLILAQFDEFGPDKPLINILANPDEVTRLLNNLPEQRLTLYSYATVGVPVSPDALDNLADENFDTEQLESQFVMVEAELSERIFFGDNGQPVSTIGLSIRVEPEEYRRAYAQGYSLPAINVEFDQAMASLDLEGLDDTITLEGTDRTFVESKATPLQAVEEMTHREVTFTFGDGLAGMTLALDTTR